MEDLKKKARISALRRLVEELDDATLEEHAPKRAAIIEVDASPIDENGDEEPMLADGFAEGEDTEELKRKLLALLG